MDEQQIRQIAQQVFDDNQSKGALVNYQVPVHVHNGNDSKRISQFDIINGTTSVVGLTSSVSEIFTLELTKNATQLSLQGIASNGAGQKAHLNGNAQLGTCFRYGVQSGSFIRAIGQDEPFLQTCSATYLDASNIANVRVSADTSSFIYVRNEVPADVAKMVITQWTATGITFQTTLAANWYVTFFLSLS